MNIFPKEIHSDVTAIKIFNKYIFCGIGSYLNIFAYSTKERIFSERIFNGATIFDLIFHENNKYLLTFGEKYLKLFSVQQEKDELRLQEITSATSKDWVLAAVFIAPSANYVLAMTMRNTANLWQVNASEFVLLQTFSCQESCILYSAFITYDNVSGRSVFFAGTVFNTLLIWSCQLFNNKSNQVINVSRTLAGHEGVIFSIDVKDDLICTTSDDRSSILWQLDFDKSIRKCRVYGHSARVFRCKIINESFVTAGEDGLINVWSLNGNLIRKLVVTQEGQLWQLDYCSKQQLLAVGSGNGALTLFQMDKLQNSAMDTYEILLKDNRVPKLVRFIKYKNSVYVLCISTDGTLFLYDKCREILSIPHFNLGTSILMETYENLTALAGQKGDLYIYELLYEKTNIELKNIANFQKTIPNFCRLASLHWLTQKLLLICMQNGHLTLIYCHRHQMAVVGVYQLPKTKERWSNCACVVDSEHFLVGDRRGHVHLFRFPSIGKQPLRSYKVHSYLGVTAIYRKSNGLIATVGRDGFVKYLRIANDNVGEISENQMPFNWITNYCETDNKIMGFEGKRFLVYDYNERRTLFEYDCGGGHRSSDFHLLKNNLTHFVYIKNKSIYLVQYNLNIESNIIGSWHANVINCLVTLPFNCFISGGEDTTIRLAKFDSKFQQMQIVKSHLSSVRCLATKSIDSNTCYVVSAGGRAQLILWKVNFHNESKSHDIELINSFYEEAVNDSETRIMDVEFNSEHIIAVCSDGSIKVFQLELKQGQLVLSKVHSETYESRKCILKCCIVENYACLITMATDGCLVFWKIVKKPSWKLKQIQRVHLHQSGVNSCHWQVIKDDLIGILTGGDDNAIHFTIFRLADGEFTIIKQFFDCGAHCAQISSCFIHPFNTNNNCGLLFTVSKDQKLVVFQWKYNCEMNELHCNKSIIYNTSIADAEGLQIINKTDGNLQIVIYGRGIEFLDVNISVSKRNNFDDQKTLFN